MRPHSPVALSEVVNLARELAGRDPNVDPSDDAEVLCFAVDALSQLKVPLAVNYECSASSGTRVPEGINKQLWGQVFGLKMVVSFRDQSWIVVLLRTALGSVRWERFCKSEI